MRRRNVGLAVVPISIPMAPKSDQDVSKEHDAEVIVKAPARINERRPWVIRGTRLWLDSGDPCNERLESQLCEHSGEYDGGNLTCMVRGRTVSATQNPETGEFEIIGHGSAVVFAGVQVEEGYGGGWQVFDSDVTKGALVPVAGGETRDLVLWCQPRGDVLVQVLNADGSESVDDWGFLVQGEGYSRIGSGNPRTVKDAPAGVPVWVHVFKSNDGVAGMWKQIVIERDVCNTVKFQLNPEKTTKLTGRVVDQATGAPLSPVRVWADLVGGSHHVLAQTLTDADGRYSLELSPGTWQIEMSDRIGHGWRNVLVPGKVLVSGEMTFDVALTRLVVNDGVPASPR